MRSGIVKSVNKSGAHPFSKYYWNKIVLLKGLGVEGRQVTLTHIITAEPPSKPPFNLASKYNSWNAPFTMDQRILNTD